MHRIISIQVPYYQINNTTFIRECIRQETGLRKFYFSILKKSIDSRNKPVKFTLKILVSDIPVDDSVLKFQPIYKEVHANSPVVFIVGAGPAGLFAALQCLELGIKPIIFEQGKTVRDRRRDLAKITKYGLVNPLSNYCFGEGGAGTYSDGKLYTRSDKRGDIKHILNYFVYFGASSDILTDAHPHIGTNKLPQIIENIRNTIIRYGGEIYFEHLLTDIYLDSSKTKIEYIEVKDLQENISKKIPCPYLILATGHSARAIYQMLYNKGIHIEFKPFAIGVRVEHPQDWIDSIQYHCVTSSERENIRKYLPPARYSLVHTESHFSAYSFCMCPGGIIAPCATDAGEVVTNGWSPSKRNNRYANSGIVIALNERIIPDANTCPLAGVYFQRNIEVKCFEMGGKNLFAPAQRLTDFVSGKTSSTLPDCSYKPGVTATSLKECLPEYIFQSLQKAFKQFDKKMRGFITEESIVVAPESRTSSPVRIPRNKETYQHVQVKNLYPCAEGAGYAGGIMSAAIDGINVVKALFAEHLQKYGGNKRWFVFT